MEIRLSSDKIWVYDEAIDFRKSIDGLTEIASRYTEADLRCDVFIFHNRNKDKIKVLAWHRNGFVLLYKRLERGRFPFRINCAGHSVIDERQLSWLLAGLDWEKCPHGIR